MNMKEHLYTIVTEECAEVQQAVSKTLRFGKDNYAPNGSPEHTNEKQLLEEYYQLQAVMEMLFAANIINDLPSDEILQIKANKKKNVMSYMKASEYAGCLQKDSTS